MHATDKVIVSNMAKTIGTLVVVGVTLVIVSIKIAAMIG